VLMDFSRRTTSQPKRGRTSRPPSSTPWIWAWRAFPGRNLPGPGASTFHRMYLRRRSSSGRLGVQGVGDRAIPRRRTLPVPDESIPCWTLSQRGGGFGACAPACVHPGLPQLPGGALLRRALGRGCPRIVAALTIPNTQTRRGWPQAGLEREFCRPAWFVRRHVYQFGLEKLCASPRADLRQFSPALFALPLCPNCHGFSGEYAHRS